MIDLTGWELVLAWGYSSLLFKKGNRRILIDKHTLETIIEFDFD